jgi:hypothetical protein
MNLFARKGNNMESTVTLTFEDDETLFTVATGLANIADLLDAGEAVPDLSQMMRVASMMIAGVMADAYERKVSQN